MFTNTTFDRLGFGMLTVGIAVSQSGCIRLHLIAFVDLFEFEPRQHSFYSVQFCLESVEKFSEGKIRKTPAKD